MIWLAFLLYSGKLGNRSEARASDLKSHPGFWWNRIKLRLYEGRESAYSPRTCSIGRPAGGTQCPRPITLQMASSTPPNTLKCTRSRPGAERLRQGEGRLSRPPKTAFERSYSTGNSRSDNRILRPRRKKTPDRIPPPKNDHKYIYIVHGIFI